MNEDNARRFARRMIDTWPSGPRAYVWEEIAAKMDTAIAREAMHRLECDASVRTITTGLMWQAYNAERAKQTAIDELPMRCEQCNGTGFVDGGLSEHASSTSIPCRCSIGLARRDAHNRILVANGHRAIGFDA